VRPGAAGEAARITRAFSVPAGEYDVYVVLKDRTPADPKEKGKPADQRFGYLKETVTVPDFWTSEITTSSVILVEDVKPADKSGGIGQSLEQPYTLGGSVFTPVTSNRLPKRVDVFPVFFVYNTRRTAAGSRISPSSTTSTSGLPTSPRSSSQDEPAGLNAMTLPRSSMPPSTT